MYTIDHILDTLSDNLKTTIIVYPDSIPSIDLYMDQVTTFMDTALRQYKRNAEDKILTKTMINNYTKAKIFPPPIKKKYSRMHVMLLIMIYHLKSVLSINDIGTLFFPILHNKTKEVQEKAVAEIYTGFVELQKSYMEISREDINNSVPEKYILDAYEDETNKKILLVLFLSIRAYTEKHLAESLLDSYF